MAAALTARAGLLQALRQGPGAVPELIERLHRSSKGGARVRQGPASVALRALEKDGLIRGWTVPAAPSGRGRPRRYYELTGRGIEEAELQRAALGGILGFTQQRNASSRERRAMRERLAEALALSDFAITLRNAPRRRLS